MLRSAAVSGRVLRKNGKRGFIAGLALFAAVAAPNLLACYSTDNGTAPARDILYYPVGIATSPGGRIMYVANSDFDLAYTGGTLQALDLALIRKHAALAAINAADPALPRVRPNNGSCPSAPTTTRPDGNRQALGETCAPPVDPRAYIRSSVVIGAFATDVQIARCEAPPTNVAEKYAAEAPCDVADTRLYVPVRGDTTLSWVEVPIDTGTGAVDFSLRCGADGSGRCDAAHRAGRGDEPNNTRGVVLPNEPFALAQSQDGTHMVVSHQVDGKASLLTSGVAYSTGAKGANATTPALQWVLEGITIGGNGMVGIPHDRALACTSDEPCSSPPPQPAYLQTSRYVAGIDLLRYYPDSSTVASSLKRPFLSREGTFAVRGNAGGSDSRDIIIDRSPRLVCKADVRKNVPASDPLFAARMRACARLPARVFVANRAPASIVYGEVGGGDAADYNPDRIVLGGSVPLSSGPSHLYLAPIVDANGNYALRLFVVCFDAQTVFIMNPDSLTVENVLRLAPGPFAMGFDPFLLEEAAIGAPVRAVADETRRAYRFAYIASFTDSFIHVIDLDNSNTNKDTFERPVLAVGDPTPPKGT